MKTDESDSGIRALCASLPRVEPSDYFRTRVMAAVREDALRRKRGLLWKIPSAVFACGLLLAGFFLIARPFPAGSEPDTGLLVSYAEDRRGRLEEFANAPGETAAFGLFVDFWEYARSRTPAADEQKIRVHYSWLMGNIESLIGQSRS